MFPRLPRVPALFLPVDQFGRQDQKFFKLLSADMVFIESNVSHMDRPSLDLPNARNPHLDQQGCAICPIQAQRQAAAPIGRSFPKVFSRGEQ